MSPAAAIALAVVLLAGNAFFVGAEFALISARRSQIEPLAAAGSRRARATLGAMERVSLMMACAQLGITVCSLGLGAVGEPAVAGLLEGPFEAAGVPEGLLHPLSFALSLGIVVVLHMVLGEMVPKNIAIAGPERSALALGPPLAALVRVLGPVITVLNAAANAVLRAVGVEPRDEVTSSYTADEVAALAAEAHEEGLLDADEHGLLSGALAFDDRTVERVLLARAALTTLGAEVTPAQVQDAAARTGYSRFPVAAADGGLAGYLHVKDALTRDPAAREAPLDPARVRPLATVRRDDPLRAALTAMQSRGAHLARVTDADGRDVGVVALEDVLEEIVGEVSDAGQSAGARP
jgi:CBS domain containing-hemolysin-like protein